ncbi:MAG TPA: phosphoglucomutase/phosphomannomutase family protein [Candidatus Omnitrophota bacterium]|nr:phosphoglucomutase/phosphomannomutase family protein [Candidatus Omnitrophota bacterium]HPN88126.1 phosphoglucomutase/phosphomannomutase family protein [Candidatus Omnitrophota bacterium]
MSCEIKFGTDGWRAVISDTFTFKNVAIVGQAIAEWIKEDFATEHKRVSIAYDTRFLSGKYAEIVACILAQNGMEVLLSQEPIPTPALSYGVVNTKSVCGVMITASHNPGEFNGIKIKNRQGGGASKDITNKVESFFERTPVQTIKLKDALSANKIKMHDFKAVYLKFMKSYVDLAKIKKAKFKIIQDVMHGSGRRILEEVLKGSQLRVTLMRADINPSFGGTKPEPIAEYLPELLSRVKKEKFDLGLVLDGDADRIAAVAPGGEFISPQKILGLIILHLARNRGRKGGIVKTTCGTVMLDNIAKKLNLKLYETPVGFKYISDLMVSEEIIAGGEEAGGIGVQDYIPERDGTLAGLLLLEMMVFQKKNIKKLLDDMEKEFGRYYYERADLALGDGKYDPEKIKQVKELLGKKVVEIKDFDGVKLICEDQSWLMLRPSGTEPLVRAYSESKSLKKSKDLLKIGEGLLKN